MEKLCVWSAFIFVYENAEPEHVVNTTITAMISDSGCLEFVIITSASVSYCLLEFCVQCNNPS